jgi:rubrerythrin
MRLIDADELMTEIMDSDLDHLQRDDWKEIIQIVQDAPTIQPQRMRGRWKRTYLDHEAMGERPSIFYCSACNQCIAYPTNYCPSCGADMKEEQDGENM